MKASKRTQLIEDAIDEIFRELDVKTVTYKLRSITTGLYELHLTEIVPRIAEKFGINTECLKMILINKV